MNVGEPRATRKVNIKKASKERNIITLQFYECCFTTEDREIVSVVSGTECTHDPSFDGSVG